MDSKLKRQISVHSQAKANREVATTPLFKLYQTKRASEDGLIEGSHQGVFSLYPPLGRKVANPSFAVNCWTHSISFPTKSTFLDQPKRKAGA
jgi:hypothetical protein